MTDTTIASFTDRFGGTAWVVTWGKGMTQSRIALSYEEAESIARGERIALSYEEAQSLGSPLR